MAVLIFYIYCARTCTEEHTVCGILKKTERARA